MFRVFYSRARYLPEKYDESLSLVSLPNYSPLYGPRPSRRLRRQLQVLYLGPGRQLQLPRSQRREAGITELSVTEGPEEVEERRGATRTFIGSES